MSVLRFETGSARETMATGREIAAMLRPPMLLILRGELGAGKTTLVKGIAQTLQVADPDEITSPTFTLIHEHIGRRISQEESVSGADRARSVTLYHLDVYRLETERELESLGLEDLAREDAIVLVEWGEKFASIAGLSDGEIVIEHAGGDHRVVTIDLRYRLS